MFDPFMFRGMVVSKFKSISAFAKALGWTPGKTNRVVNNLDRATVADFVQMIRVLGITDMETVRTIFLQM